MDNNIIGKKMPIPFIYLDFAKRLYTLKDDTKYGNRKKMQYITNVSWSYDITNNRKIPLGKFHDITLDLIRAWEYNATLISYFLDIILKNLGLDNDKHIYEGKTRYWVAQNIGHKEFSYKKDAKTIMNDYIINIFRKDIQKHYIDHIQIYNPDMNIRTLESGLIKYQKTIDSIITNPILKAHFQLNPLHKDSIFVEILLDNKKTGRKRFPNYPAYAVFYNWFNNLNEKYKTRNTIQLIDDKYAPELTEIFEEGWPNWEYGTVGNTIHKKIKHMLNKIIMEPDLKLPCLKIFHNTDSYAHMDKGQDYITFTLVMDEIEFNDIKSFTGKSNLIKYTGQNLTNPNNRIYRYRKDKVGDPAMYQVVTLYISPEEVDLDVKIGTLPEDDGLYSIKYFAQAATEYMEDGGVLPDWESVLPRVRRGYIPILITQNFINWIKDNPLGLK